MSRWAGNEEEISAEKESGGIEEGGHRWAVEWKEMQRFLILKKWLKIVISFKYH